MQLKLNYAGMYIFNNFNLTPHVLCQIKLLMRYLKTRDIFIEKMEFYKQKGREIDKR